MSFHAKPLSLLQVPPVHKVYACLAVTCHLHFWQNDWDLLHATAVTPLYALRISPKEVLVSGARIDQSHHQNNAYNALHDTIAFSNAVEAAAALTSEQDTLTVTTADHSHTMVIAGYQSRGNPIFSESDNPLS